MPLSPLIMQGDWHRVKRGIADNTRSRRNFTVTRIGKVIHSAAWSQCVACKGNITLIRVSKMPAQFSSGSWQYCNKTGNETKLQLHLHSTAKEKDTQQNCVTLSLYLNQRFRIVGTCTTHLQTNCSPSFYSALFPQIFFKFIILLVSSHYEMLLPKICLCINTVSKAGRKRCSG